jgi:hypothetical protein
MISHASQIIDEKPLLTNDLEGAEKSLIGGDKTIRESCLIDAVPGL